MLFYSSSRTDFSPKHNQYASGIASVGLPLPPSSFSGGKKIPRRRRNGRVVFPKYLDVDCMHQSETKLAKILLCVQFWQGNYRHARFKSAAIILGKPPPFFPLCSSFLLPTFLMSHADGQGKRAPAFAPAAPTDSFLYCGVASSVTRFLGPEKREFWSKSKKKCASLKCHIF